MSGNEWNPTEKYRQLVILANEILEDEERTVRDVYYALEARGYEYDYRQVKRGLKKGRRAGYIDPKRIVDSSRPASATPTQGYDTLREFYEKNLKGLHYGYTENFWKEQPEYVEFWLEKQSLESVFKPICDSYNVRLECTRGDWSDSKVVEAKERIEEKIRAGKDVTILYAGDYNPSGYHAPVSIQNTLQVYGLNLGRQSVGNQHPEYYDIRPQGRVHYSSEDGEELGSIAFERVAINTPHVERFDLPPNPNPSSTDKDRQLRDSFMRYVTPEGEGEGDLNIELNALKEFRREFLEDLIKNSIEAHINEAAREEVEERIEERREAIKEAVEVDQDAFDANEGGETNADV